MFAVNMDILVIIFVAYVVACKCYHFPKITVSKYNVPIVNLRGVNESVVIVTQNDSDDQILTSLIAGLYEHQSVLIAKADDYFKVRRGFENSDPNIIIFTKTILTSEELNLESFNALLNNYWSPVYIIVTEKNGTETCQNGIFNRTYLENVRSCLNLIWHRYKIIRLVISFPFTCTYYHIIYGGKEKSNVDLYDRTIEIINAKSNEELARAILKNNKYRDLTAGYPLKVNIFDRFPTSISSCDDIEMYKKVKGKKKINLNDTKYFCGLDALVMKDYINYYKFNLTVSKDEACDVYGFENPETQRVTGSLGCIVNKEIDISFNSRFMVLYTAKKYSYLHYITTDSLSAVLKIPDVIPLWYYAFNMFNIKTGITLCILIVMLGILTWIYARIVKDIDQRVPRRLHDYILNALTCTMCGFSIKKSKRFYILRGTSLLCSVILMAYYQGNVNYLFTTRIRQTEIMTSDELFKSDNTLYTSSSIKHLLVNDVNNEDKEEIEYINQVHLNDKMFGIGYVLENDRVAMIERRHDAQIQILMNFTDINGSPLIYIVDEPFHDYYLSYICNNDFLFIEETLRFMMRLLEAGLPNKYYVWTRRSLKLGDSYPQTSASPRPYSKINLGDMRVAFIVLGAGCLLSFFSFIVEVYRGKALKSISV